MKKETDAAGALSRELKRQLFKNNRWNLAVGSAAMLLVSLANLAFSWLMQQVIDLATGAEGPFTLLQLVWISAAVTAGIGLALLLDYFTVPRFMKRAMRQYKDLAFAKISEKSIDSFNGESTAAYISALTNDASSIETNYLAKMFTLMQEGVMFVGAFAMMLWYSPILTLFAVLFSLLPVVASILTGNRLAAEEKKVSERNESFVATVKDMLGGFSVIKSFKAEIEAVRLFSKSNEDAEDAKCARRRVDTVIQAIGALAGVIALSGVFLFGAYLALSGRGVTAGVVIIFVQLMNFVITPIADVPQILANRKAALALVDKLAAAVTANVRRPGKTVDNRLDDAVELHDVGFAYEPGKPVLHDVGLRFEAGRSYAVVGGSGSGKSTLLNLLMGGYENYEGTIAYDGDELRSISSDSLYDLVSIVQQNVFVFNSSVADNITMFKACDPEKLNRVIEMSGLAPLIAERGSDYACGENGCGLSGGERQRISIARCLMRGTPVMLVDEATASLDAETAFAVTRSILNIEGLTRIIVTHRLDETLLRAYDRIFVLKNGAVGEQGTFDELMAQKGYFYSLYTVAQ